MAKKPPGDQLTMPSAVQPNPPNPSWQARPEAGSSSGIRFLMWLARKVGRAPLRGALYPVALYFMAVRGPERRASKSYLQRALKRPASWLDVYKHFVCFAQVAADRFFFFAGRGADIPIRFVGGHAAQRIVEAGNAGIFLAAHLGSFEAARVIGPELGGIDLRIVLDKKFSGRFLQLMAEVNPELAQQIIDSEQGAVELGLAIKNAIDNNSWVGFLADRFRTGDRSLALEFLGTKAHFPVGPYIIANTLKAPVICTFCRLKGNGYEVHCEVLSPRVDLPRGNRNEALEALALTYAQRLEHHVQASPYSWFNFYDFWADRP